LTYRLDCGNLARAGRDVVDGDAAVGLRREPVVEQEAVRDLRHALVASVLSSEVDVGCPVIAEIVGGTAGGAGSLLGNVGRRHRDVEGVASYDLVHVRRRRPARLNERVEALDRDLRAAESEVV
jgi:hypothetical protein